MAKIRRIFAEELHAGTVIEVKEGTVKHYFKLCEVHVQDDLVEFVYKTRGRFVHNEVTVDDIVRVRR